MSRWALDDLAVPRRLDAIQPFARLAVIGEAVGPKTLRLSGVSFFGVDGKIGPTGRYLDEILRSVNHTVYPSREIRLPHGVIDPGPGGDRSRVYATDLCPRFPGYWVGKGERARIRRPARETISEALTKNFLQREVTIIRPRVILLLGGHTYHHFYSHFLGLDSRISLTSLVTRLGKETLPTFGRSVVVPFLHPSPASPTFLRWFSRNRRSLGVSPLAQRLNEFL
jgi:hypothetical protein